MLLNFLAPCGLYLFFSTYGVCFGPLEVGYRTEKVFDSGWMEYLPSAIRSA